MVFWGLDCNRVLNLQVTVEVKAKVFFLGFYMCEEGEGWRLQHNKIRIKN